MDSAPARRRWSSHVEAYEETDPDTTPTALAPSSRVSRPASERGPPPAHLPTRFSRPDASLRVMLRESCTDPDCDWEEYWEGGSAEEDPAIEHSEETGHVVNATPVPFSVHPDELDEDHTESVPWWVVVAESTETTDEQDVYSASVRAHNAEEAEEEGGFYLKERAGHARFAISHARGPFPGDATESDASERPSECAGCGLHTWPADRPPCPRSTWFTADRERYTEGVTWECVACGTLTILPDEGG